jgi:O-antigen/teichoic acid export membrane protein
MLRAALIRFFYLAIMFLAGLVLSNLALPEHFGSISLLVLNASLFSLITGLGSDSMVIYKVSNDQWNISKAFQFTWGSILIQVLIFVAFEFGSWFLTHKTLLSDEASDYLIIEAVYFIGLVVTEKYTALFYSLHKTRPANTILALVGFIYLLLLLLFCYYIRVTLLYVFYAFAFQSLVQALVLVLFFGVVRVEQASWNMREFLRAVRLSSVVMATNVIQLFVYRIDFWLLKYFYSNYEVGVYAQANKFANLCWVIPNVLAQLLRPKFASMDRHRIKEVFSVAFYVNILIVLSTTLCTLFVYFFYLRPEYKGGLIPFYLMLPGYFFWASVIFFAAYVSSTGKFLYNLVASSSCFVLIVFADLMLIPQYGMKGAAIANSLCYTAVFFIYFYVLKRRFSFNWNGFLSPYKETWYNVFKIVSS